jgi:dnd system-associated protein 4
MEPRRIRPPKKFESLMNDLIEDDYFATKQQLLMFCAAIGFKNGKRNSLSNPGEGIRFSIFQDRNDHVFFYALAIAEHDSIDCLDKSNDKYEDPIALFEEYACGGLAILNAAISDKPTGRDEIIQEFIQPFIEDEENSGLSVAEKETLRIVGTL